jgi:hypothetical protein
MRYYFWRVTVMLLESGIEWRRSQQPAVAKLQEFSHAAR